jgi:formate hydrogenlyase subunit 6/NADH:ubiquinone oxidoreductase subunit I
MATKKPRDTKKASGKAGGAAVKTPEKATAPEPKMVSIYIMGKEYKVPEGLTIQKALEYAGMRLLRGCGCRGGFCGACGTVYRTRGDYKLKVALACQTVVEDGMFLTQIPFYPANKSTYVIEELAPVLDSIVENYPEVMRCVQCNTCRKVCPQDIEVMQYIAAAMRGDIAKLADLSFDCIMCGLCASRCPGELVQYYIAILGRRLYAKYMMAKAEHLARRLEELEEGKYDKELEDLMKMSKADLRKLYDARDIEPEEEVGETVTVVSKDMSD